MPPPESAFLAEIHAAPGDPCPKLVFADWLEEQGDLRGSLIRAQEQVKQAEDVQLIAERDALARQLWNAQQKNLRQQLLKQSPDRVQLVLAADTTGRTLSVFEYHFPKDRRPRQAIEALRALLRGEVDEAAWRSAQQAAQPAARLGGDRTGQAVDAICASDPVKMVSLSGRVGGAKEREWQLTRLVDLRLYGAEFPCAELQAGDQQGS